MPTSLIGIVVFYSKDIKYVSSTTKSGIPVKVWSRNHFIDENQTDLALEMTVKIFNELEEIFKNVSSSLPEKIDVIAIPDYPVSFFFITVNKFNSSNFSLFKRMMQFLILVYQFSQRQKL